MNTHKIPDRIRQLATMVCIAATLLHGIAFGQQSGMTGEELTNKLSLYSKTHALGLLFVHTDKTIYTNNETIWFSGYLLKSGLGRTNDHTILSVSLMREDNRQVTFEEQYVMENGLSNGSMLVPDTIPPGNYLFNACTNVLDQHGKPVAVFLQPLTIKTIMQRKFDASLMLVDTAVVNGFVRTKITLNIKDERRKGRPGISYSTGGNDKARTITLADAENSTVISIPAAELSKPEPVLLARVAYNYDTLYLSVKLPKIQAKGLNVRFFPEGGNLTDGLPSTVSMEVTTSSGLPVSISGIVYKDDKPVETIRTNGYGVARFGLKPDRASHYTFKVKANVYLDRDTVYALPGILDNGIAIQLNEGVIKDTLHLTIYSSANRKVQVLVHNYREAFSLFSTEATPAGRRLSIVASLPKGIATVTVLDEQGRPLAERLFFAHYDKRINATITTEKQIYKKRDSVAVKLKLKDQTGKPVSGLVSVAVVQDNRMEGAKQQDIESYVYLSNDLGTLPRDPLGRAFDNKSYLEDMLLVKGWRRYTWQDMLQNKVTDTLTMGPQPVFAGQVLNYGKPVKKTVEFMILRNALFDKIKTATDGSFKLSPDQLLVTEGRKLLLWLDKPANYTLRINNPFRSIDGEVAATAPLTITGTAQAVQSSSDQQLKGMEKSTTLKEVVIKANKGDDRFFGVARTNACGDYVCKYGALNCPYHEPFRAPLKGEHLGFHVAGTTRPMQIIYQGCTTGGQQSAGIYSAREFYGLDRDPASKMEPQYLSTLFWKPGILVNGKGEALFSFFTGDITGEFHVVVQGLGERDMIYKAEALVVK